MLSLTHTQTHSPSWWQWCYLSLSLSLSLSLTHTHTHTHTADAKEGAGGPGYRSPWLWLLALAFWLSEASWKPLKAQEQKSGAPGASLNDNSLGLLIAGPNIPWDPSVWTRPQVVLLLPVSLKSEMQPASNPKALCKWKQRKILGSIFFERDMCLASYHWREGCCPASYPGQGEGNWGVLLKPCYMPVPFTLTTSFNPHPLE